MKTHWTILVAHFGFDHGCGDRDSAHSTCFGFFDQRLEIKIAAIVVVEREYSSSHPVAECRTSNGSLLRSSGQLSEPRANDILSASTSALAAIASIICEPAVGGSSGIGSRAIGLTLCLRISCASLALSSRPDCGISVLRPAQACTCNAST